MSTEQRVEAEAEIDRLFQAPLQQFTGTRHALAARLRKAGDTAKAAEVTSLAKPTISAWVVNQLYWTAKPVFMRLLAAGDRLRSVQQARLTGRRAGDLQEALEQRNVAVAALLALVPGLLVNGGLAATQATRQRVATTLEAIASYGSRQTKVQFGRLSTDLDPPGFEALAGLAAAAGPAQPLRLVPKEPIRKGPAAKESARHKAARERAEASRVRAQADLARAEREAMARRAEAARAVEVQAAAERRLEAARADLKEAERRLAAAAEQASDATEALRVAKEQAKNAEAHVRRADQFVERARTTVDRFA